MTAPAEDRGRLPRFPLSPLRPYRVIRLLVEVSNERSYVPSGSPEWHRLYDVAEACEESLHVRIGTYDVGLPPPAPRTVRYDADRGEYVPIFRPPADCLAASTCERRGECRALTPCHTAATTEEVTR